MTTIIIDATSSKESDCQMKFNYMNIQGLRREKVKSSLSFGSAVHLGIATYLKEKDRSKAMMAAQEYFLMAPTEFKDNDYRTASLLKRVLDEYFATYGEFDMFKTKPEYVELPFALPFHKSDGVEFVLSGVVDALGSYLDREVVFKDIKTSSSNYPDSYLAEYYMSFQMMTYAWAIRELGWCNYYPPVMIDGIFMRAGYKSKKTGEVGESSIGFKRSGLIDYRSDLIEEHINWLHERCELIAASVRAGKFSRNFSRCITTFGPCEYYNVCSAQEAYREGLIQSQFIRKVYDPATFGD